MLTNYHTHTTFCDGKDTAEEMVIVAIDKGFKSLGISEHMTTRFYNDHSTKALSEYIDEIKRLKEKYKKEIEIYLGIEEDNYSLCDRSRFEYIIGSCHKVKFQNKLYALDNNYEEFLNVLALFENNPIKLAEEYYSEFCNYILWRKPDIVGHFDLITKFDQKESSIFFNNKEYIALSEKYIKEALKSDCIFEINTGAIACGYRTTPYPAENLLYIMKENNAKITLSSDCHDKRKLDCNFTETRFLLKDIGFKYTYILLNNEFVKEEI